MVLLIALLLCSFRLLDAQQFDLILRNGRVVDGMGNPWYRADVAIRDGRVSAIGDLRDRAARRTIDMRLDQRPLRLVQSSRGTSSALCSGRRDHGATSTTVQTEPDPVPART